MRGRISGQPTFFLTMNLESDIPADHPLRAIKKRCGAILPGMSRDLNAASSRMGRPSIPPEQLLKAMLLLAIYAVRSEIQLMQQVQFKLLYRWFLDLYDGPAWTPEVCSMNRVVSEALTENRASREHFSVDGTLIESRQMVPHVPVRKAEKVPQGAARWRARRRMKTKGYSISRRIRKRVEEIFGWCKTVGHLAKVRLVGRWKLALEALITGPAYNLLRLAKLKPV